ncbi:2-hydroxychromene-2-carboxylate isomerase [Rhodobacteraceae bacterium THAF1]|uniref:2-hydroxychromene-2-carboxylate isomerase n=1 Tax=Palleronia sp. THAF1 TaxID=2587842 RepID=UPI000F3FAF02|nr:2-hydroxychromene-2-carboxylate isomerase [Palleronia sp. THAF1]QFU09628.1 2-hydroxychromene-2-carboxylate isomerase [Palleronia sp. THAF1]VDC17471.1 2-hydroxychromene-2-carboxylate isomerase [Rhodobacteraceae bacterium THAF1]
MAHIDYYFATVSPFTYLAGTRLETIAAKHGATITYKPLDVIQLFGRTGGVPPKDRHPNRQDYRLQELARIAAMEDLPINLKPAHWPTNPAPSSFAIIAAQKAGGGDIGALVHGLCRACWAEEKNIAEDDVIAEKLDAAGFDPSLASSAMLSAADDYARNLEDAVMNGAFGAPFYITDSDDRFWGQDRLDHLDWQLSR